MTHRLEVHGRGTAETEAHGPADAEHRVEREIGAIWPAARVAATHIERLDDPDRLVGRYRITYAVRGTVEVGSPEKDPDREAFRRLRARFASTRYRTVEWLRAVPARPTE